MTLLILFSNSLVSWLVQWVSWQKPSIEETKDLWQTFKKQQHDKGLYGISREVSVLALKFRSVSLLAYTSVTELLICLARHSLKQINKSYHLKHKFNSWEFWLLTQHHTKREKHYFCKDALLLLKRSSNLLPFSLKMFFSSTTWFHWQAQTLVEQDIGSQDGLHQFTQLRKSSVWRKELL